MTHLVKTLERMTDAQSLPADLRGPMTSLCRDLHAIASFYRLPPDLVVGCECLLDCLNDLDRLGGKIAPSDLQSLRELVQDLRGKAARIIAQAGADIALRAQAACETIAPVDLADLQLVQAAPSPHDTDMLTATGFTDRDFGSISGKAFFRKARLSRRSAPRDSMIIPRRSVVHVADRQSFLLHHCGLHVGADVDLPDKCDMSTLLVEADADGLLLHGPLVISPLSPQAEVPFALAQGVLRLVAPIADWAQDVASGKAFRRAAHGRSGLGRFSISRMNEERMVIPVPDIVHDGRLKAILDQLSPGEWDRRGMKFGTHIRFDEKIMCYSLVFALPDVSHCDKMTAIPADLVVTGADGRPRVMKPVLALPAPAADAEAA